MRQSQVHILGTVASSDNLQPTDTRRVSALPSPWRRALAFLAIVIGGVCGALIGFGFADLSCTGECETTIGGFTLLGAIVGAGGVAIVAVLALRAMDEWESIRSATTPRRKDS